MKRIISLSSILMCSIILGFSAFSQIVLEHTFDGNYFPYNFPVYEDADTEPYFASPSINVTGNNVTLISYNEDYTLRDYYHVTYDIPAGYKPSSIAFSPSLRLTDGTPMFMVTFKSETISLGDKNYCIAKMYDARNGSFIEDIDTSTFSITIFNAVYNINGKPSICVQNISYDRNSEPTTSYTYTTKIFSLGTPVSSGAKSISGERHTPAPIMYYDINGNILSGPAVGTPYIGVNPDGSSSVYLNTSK
ncbi:MAG: hypothetical protein K2H86_01045 [Muribaculaceae bacterium]|nr:hypothetical protein [Muribaculaceae bacterium]